MRITFRNQVQIFRENANRFDPVSIETKLQCLHHLSGMSLQANQDLKTYFEILLFSIAYPSDAKQLLLAEKELHRLTQFLKPSSHSKITIFENTGMPFTDIVTRFSHSAVKWLLGHRHCSVTLDSFEEPKVPLREVLSLTLNSLEKSETTASHNNFEIMDTLQVSKSKQLEFIINELSRLDQFPFIKDHLFEQLDLYVRVRPLDKYFSKGYNRLPGTTPFFHHELLKKIDVPFILNSPLPDPVTSTEPFTSEVIEVVKNSMAITSRETDPTTYMEENTFRLYHLERGISIAIYGMIPPYQLPLESYVGYTAFKNGFPAAYGGAWVFGERANIGVNVFESFRNGESGYIMAQLLRLYRHVFKLQYFEVEPYQFGLDNPEGIESGAFWFYYRFGFRPLENVLLEKSKKEHEKIISKKGYRTSHKTLIEFTGSSIALNLGKKVPPRVVDITTKVTRMIQHTYKGNRHEAEVQCRQKFLQQNGMNETITKDEDRVFTEVALWAEALHVADTHKLRILKEMIFIKPKDLYHYQDLLLAFYA